ncbi:TetR/AcrR family transcriptional regulator C-terminal ligand-binding domain-containing protein [Nonomuraea typhae]|uniref:TetR/AcrR family transcriptional regulator C-terminal ligand-binding domain-containing protein n=1 Tax=Nonomuraea typhae TaxID=2603600 RepID=A0ABW7YUR2_9ACTN
MSEQVKKVRRRGQALLDAIYQAVLAELAEVGFRRLTMEGIAARAGTGRMPLYRRWDTPEALVLDALAGALAATRAPVDTGDVREDLLAHFRTMTGQIMAGDLGAALGAVMGERLHHPELVATVRDRLLRPHLDAIEASLRRAAARGQLAEGVVSAEVCAAGPALITVHHLINGAPPGEAELAAIVDNLVLPALGVTSARSSG